MVQSILAGKKTQTRRIVSSLRGFGRVSEFGPSDTAGYDWHFRDRRALWNDVSNDRLLDLCAYGAPGDQLWVRETWQAIHADTDPETGSGNGVHAAYDIPPGPANYWQVAYAADPDMEQSPEERGFPWRPAIHMPRWASRVTLEVTAVRIERVQDISGADAEREGCEARPFPGPWWQGYRRGDDGNLNHTEVVGEQPPDWMIEPHPMQDMRHLDRSARDAFHILWERINYKRGYGWNENPWAWAVEFARRPGTKDYDDNSVLQRLNLRGTDTP